MIPCSPHAFDIRIIRSGRWPEVRRFHTETEAMDMAKFFTCWDDTVLSVEVFRFYENYPAAILGGKATRAERLAQQRHKENRNGKKSIRKRAKG